MPAFSQIVAETMRPSPGSTMLSSMPASGARGGIGFALITSCAFSRVAGTKRTFAPLAFQT
jgi:glycerate kinase